MGGTLLSFDLATEHWQYIRAEFMGTWMSQTLIIVYHRYLGGWGNLGEFAELFVGFPYLHCFERIIRHDRRAA
jgi:hypothetical protein